MKIVFGGMMSAGKTYAYELIKTFICAGSGISNPRISDPLYEAQAIFTASKNRQLLQGLGDLVRGIFGQDVLMDMFRQRVGEMESSGNWIICDDLRLPEELVMFREMGFITVWIETPVALRRQRGIRLGTWNDLTHKTEQQLPLDLFDYIIYNDGSKADFERAIGALLNEPCLDRIAV